VYDTATMMYASNTNVSTQYVIARRLMFRIEF
jgi:hypothetical protein